eukprot:scaffold26696_cov60-Phaeocystis_antarctica.AAC.4
MSDIYIPAEYQVLAWESSLANKWHIAMYEDAKRRTLPSTGRINSQWRSLKYAHVRHIPVSHYVYPTARCKLRPARISGRYLRPAERDLLSRVILPVDAHTHAHAPRLGAARRHEAAHAVSLPRVGDDTGAPLQRRGHHRLTKLAAVRAHGHHLARARTRWHDGAQRGRRVEGEGQRKDGLVVLPVARELQRRAAECGRLRAAARQRGTVGGERGGDGEQHMTSCAVAEAAARAKAAAACRARERDAAKRGPERREAHVE